MLLLYHLSWPCLPSLAFSSLGCVSNASVTCPHPAYFPSPSHPQAIVRPPISLFSTNFLLQPYESIWDHGLCRTWEHCLRMPKEEDKDDDSEDSRSSDLGNYSDWE
ncbi:hypothetical protein B0H14DRAFT_767374 [Mycena olivaceomarginata]|nr:hypothetical protein B0H14DRAFT_767374 [Mycena olivaceomarginata]